MTSPLALPLAQGWLMMAGLIVAIGAQNALVLRQGLQRAHVGPVLVLCVASDWLLTGVGVFGLGGAVAASPRVLMAMRWLGAALLAAYALRAAQRALNNTAGLAVGVRHQGLPATLAATAAVTWLNPQVYLDTVLLLGAAAAGLPMLHKLGFFAGAALASSMWFVLLGLGAAALAPRLARPGVWRVIDALVSIVMLASAVHLLRPA
jgi:L-lysine exporter family protein LysE/ArgO